MKTATKCTMTCIVTLIMVLSLLCTYVSAATVTLKSASLDESEVVTFTPESAGTLTITMGAANPGWSFQIIYPDGSGTLPKTGKAAGSYDYEVKADGQYQIIFQAYDKAGWTLGDGTITYDVSFKASQGGQTVMEEYIVSDKLLALGNNSVTLDAGAITTIYEFTPDQAGTYRFTTNGGLLGYWGSGSFFLSDYTANKTKTLEQTVTAVGQSVMVGVSGVASAVIKVEKVSDYQEETIETVIYENKHVFGTYSFPAKNLVAIDIFDSTADVAVLGYDGLYRLGSKTGPIIAVDLKTIDININDASINGQLSAHVTDENGVTVKYDYNNAMMAYYKKGLYPVTEELCTMLCQIGQTRGWYVPGGFLYPDATEINADTAWMGFCSYVKGTECTKHEYNSKVTYPTLTANGYTTLTCKNCSYSYVAKYTFPDVPNTLWSYKAVEFSVAKNYFTGYKSGNFGPTDNITRQDFVVVLARIAKVDLSKYAGRTSFPDVKAGDYYEAAVKWASSTGVVSGYKNGNFGVGDKITREQLVTILYRYAQKMGYNTNVSSNASAKLYKFGDAGKVTSYAKTAVIWALDKGIISGMTASTVGPLNNASRGQVATILMNISNKKIMPW